jgi:O-antigen ligase
LNAAYSLTFPLGDRLSAMSPVSGTFQAVPLLGSYAHTALILVAGAFYYLLVAPGAAAWPGALIAGLAVFQIAWSLVFQDRSMYICTALAMVFFLFRRGERRLTAVLSGSVVVFFLALSVFGVHLEGRIGAVTPDFLASHARSILLDPTAPEEASAQWRLDLLSAVLARWSANPGAEFIGEGFGQALTDLKREGDVVVRQPHNTNVTVLVRLGTVGFLLWLGMNLAILRSLIRFIRHSRREPATQNIAVWFLLFYVMGIVVTTVQPWLEFSHGAIPFYILIGMALSLSRETAARRFVHRRAHPAVQAA